MIKVISIGMDRRVFLEGSDARKRLLKQRELFTELHVIVFAKKTHGLRAEQLNNLWLYPTNSISRWLYISDAAMLARGLIKQRDMNAAGALITAQDPFECGLAGFLASRGLIPFHLQIHTDFLNAHFTSLSLLNRVRVYAARLLLPRASGVRVVSRRIADSLHESGIALKREAFVLSVFSEYTRKWAAKSFRRFKKDEESSSLILMISRLAPEKDFPTALDAFERAFLGGTAIRLVIAGEGPEEESIRKDVLARGLASVVKMEVWQSDPSALYRFADIVLVSSRFEGYGLVLLEAAAHGQPIVTTDVGIARELITEPFERFICPVGDKEAIAERLKELANDSTLRRKYGGALRTNTKKLVLSEDEYWKRYRSDLERCVKETDERSV